MEAHVLVVDGRVDPSGRLEPEGAREHVLRLHEAALGPSVVAAAARMVDAFLFSLTLDLLMPRMIPKETLQGSNWL